MDELPDEALLMMQVEGEEGFNALRRRIAQPEPGQPIVYVKFTLKQRIARVNTPADIEKLELQLKPGDESPGSREQAPLGLSHSNPSGVSRLTVYRGFQSLKGAGREGLSQAFVPTEAVIGLSCWTRLEKG